MKVIISATEVTEHTEMEKKWFFDSVPSVYSVASLFS
jgi:hypothetical protein